jgi:hypothetical protein
MTITTHRRFAVSVLLMLALSAIAEAGGPLLLAGPGRPLLWQNGDIVFNPDQGGLGLLHNAAAVEQTTAAFGAWTAIPSARTTHRNAGMLPVDVDETNFFPFFFATEPDGLSAIIYDEDGAIFEFLFGEDSGILGFASPEWVDDATGLILEGVSFLNGGAMLGDDPLTVADFLSVQVHEFGHFQNLAHTVVNGQAAGFGDATGPSPNNTFGRPSFLGRIETMYPFIFIGGGQETPHADDIAIFSTLYPEPSFATTTATIRGRIIAPNDRTRLTGVNVIARNIANPFDDAISAISSDFATDYTSGAPFAGTYTLRGVTPGAQYAVYVDQILAGGFSTPPRILPSPEEFYNGVNESSDPGTDIPTLATLVSATAGGTASNINIILNARPPGPLPLGDDSSLEIFTKFSMRFCGQSYDSVWINSNGNLTFGVGSVAATETRASFLTGPPRIAALWDDLDPTAGGTVSFSPTAHALTVRFEDVPEFDIGGSNSFSVTLRQSPLDGSLFNFALHGGAVSLDYDGLTATNGLAGYSCGGQTTSGFETETDLSKLRVPVVLGLQKPAVYELFTTDNDLDNERFEVLTPKPFRDEFEPNDSLPVTGPMTTSARGHGGGRPLVTLPFSTHDRFSSIAPGDVDFYRFRAKAGDIIAIETLPGTPMDTLIGLFDDAGNLLVLDDDGGVGGVGGLSRLLVRLPADLTLTVGVTTYPDFGFTGNGSGAGRYVLNIRSYRGTILPLTDDSSIEVPIAGFQFPFQGSQWSSVWVNANGNLTFGAGSGDFSETVPEFLNGPPRIAAMWDDLSPFDDVSGAVQGLVVAEERAGKLLIHYVSVPEFLTVGTNYATVELDKGGGVTISYAATNRSDGLVGVTAGGGALDPGPSDLSKMPVLNVAGTVYELFLGSFTNWGGNDLSFDAITFKK